MLAVIAVRFVCFCFLFFCLVLSVDMPSSCFLWMYLLVLYSCVVSFRPEYGYQYDIRFAKISSPQSLHGIKHSMFSIWGLRHRTTFANRNTSQIREVGSRLAKFSGRDTGCFDTVLCGVHDPTTTVISRLVNVFVWQQKALKAMTCPEVVKQ